MRHFENETLQRVLPNTIRVILPDVSSLTLPSLKVTKITLTSIYLT